MKGSKGANRARAYAEFFKTKPWRKFYLMNQDYAFGHAVADDFKAVMKMMRRIKG